MARADTVKAMAAPPKIASVGRHPTSTAPPGTAIPAIVTMTYTPDCLIPVTTPRSPNGTCNAMSLLVTGLANDCETPPITAPTAMGTKEGATA